MLDAMGPTLLSWVDRVRIALFSRSDIILIFLYKP